MIFTDFSKVDPMTDGGSSWAKIAEKCIFAIPRGTPWTDLQKMRFLGFLGFLANSSGFQLIRRSKLISNRPKNIFKKVVDI